TTTSVHYTLSLHDALPISHAAVIRQSVGIDLDRAIRVEEPFPLLVADEIEEQDTAEHEHQVRLTGGEDRVVPVEQPNVVRGRWRSEEHTSELQSRFDLVCR